MKTVTVSILVTLLILVWMSPGLAATPSDDSIYYTRIGFFYERGTHKTVNYLRGVWVPINTKVEVLKKKGSIEIRMVGTGIRVDIVNEKKVSGEDINGIFERMFSREPTDLSKYTPEQQRRILSGTFELGMTKEEVVLSIGYPPRHRTPSLESNTWRYWRNRFNTVILHFKDGVLDHTVD